MDIDESPTKSREVKIISSFVVITFILSVVLSLFIGSTGGHASEYLGFGFVSMFIPAFAVLLLSATKNEGPKVDWRIFPRHYIILAVLMIPVIMHSVMLSTTILWEGGLQWQEWLSPGIDGLYHTPAERGWGIITKSQLVSHIITNAIFGLLAVSFLAFFEEIGWRGWLLPRLAELMGWRMGVVFTSMIWALWHVPFSLSEILYLGKSPSSTTVMVATFGTFSSGLVIGWLWLRTKSIWIVSIAHGALNNWGQYAFKYLDDFKVADEILVLGAGEIALLLLGIVLLLFFISDKPRK